MIARRAAFTWLASRPEGPLRSPAPAPTHCELAGSRLSHDAWSSQPLQEQCSADCSDTACQRAKSPTCLDDFAHVSNVMSESDGEPLQNGPVVMRSERCSYLFAPREGLFPIPTLRGEGGNTLQEQLGNMAGATTHLTQSRDETVPVKLALRSGMLDKLRKILLLLMTAASCCCSKRYVERASPTRRLSATTGQFEPCAPRVVPKDAQTSIAKTRALPLASCLGPPARGRAPR